MLRLGAIALALGGGVLVLAAANLPIAGSYRAMWNGALGSPASIAQTLVAATPLILTALSVIVARRGALWNFGAEGQLYAGATGATAVALQYPNLPRPLLVSAMLASGALGGAVWALGPGLIKVGFRVSEIITTVVFNFVAILLVAYLVHGRWRDPLALGFPISKELSSHGTMPALFGTAVHAGLLLGVAAALFLSFAFSRFYRRRNVPGPLGKPEETSGANISAKWGIVLVMLASGALAGVAGMGEVSGVTHRLGADISANYGYVGIVVAVLSRFSPIGVVVVAVPFGAVLVGGVALRNLGTSPWIVATLQGTIAGIVLAVELLARFRFPGGGGDR